MPSDRPTGKRDWTSSIGILITIVTTGAAIIVRFGALEEAKENAIKNLTDHEQRIAYIERNNALLERIHGLESAIVELRSELRAMREELARLERLERRR